MNIKKTISTLDTFKLLKQLDIQGFSRNQSLIIISTINDFSKHSYNQLNMKLANFKDFDLINNQKIPSTLADIKLTRKLKNIELEKQSSFIQSQIDFIDYNLTEQLMILKSDVSIDLNSYKSWLKELETDTDLKRQQVLHKLEIKVSGIKTMVETIKIELAVYIVWIAIGFIAFLMIFDYVLVKIISTLNTSNTNTLNNSATQSTTLNSFNTSTLNTNTINSTLNEKDYNFK